MVACIAYKTSSIAGERCKAADDVINKSHVPAVSVQTIARCGLMPTPASPATVRVSRSLQGKQVSHYTGKRSVKH